MFGCRQGRVFELSLFICNFSELIRYKGMKENYTFHEVHDEVTNKTLLIKGKDLEEAIGISETIEFSDFKDGEAIDVIDLLNQLNQNKEDE